MTSIPTTQPMSPEQSMLLGEFARSCRSAARSVSMYPESHPSVAASLGRLVSASDRLAGSATVALTVHPDGFAIDGFAPTRPDVSIGELATLFHERLIGVLRIEHGASADDWRSFLLLLARAPGDLVSDGGIAKVWTNSGRTHFEIQEIDYAEVLRERVGGGGAEWDRVVAFCLKGESVALDENVLAPLLEAVRDTAKFEALLDRLHQKAESTGASVNVTVAALFQLLRAAIDAVKERQAGTREEVLETMALASSHLSPEMLLAIVAQRDSGGQDAQIAQGIIERINDPTIATFVARSVAAERGATERLAQAFEALVPEQERKTHLLDLARSEAQSGELGLDQNFSVLWQGAADMLTSYTDKGFVPSDYARELSGARTQAIEVERLSDDPPERIQAWLASVAESAIRELDLTLVLDLLRLEPDPSEWTSVATIAASEIERRTIVGEFAEAQRLVDSITSDRGPEGRADLRESAERVISQLTSGQLVRHIISNFRKANDQQVESLNRLCLTIGPSIVRSLAEALTIEEHNLAIRRVRELLIKFGAAGRQAVEQLKQSSNPAVRRTAIDLLRVFGGDEALHEFASMLDDADPQVQREAVRAIVQIGTPAAYAVIERAAQKDDDERKAVVQQLIGLRDDKAIPPLCYILNQTPARGRLIAIHEMIVEALAGLSSHPDSTNALRQALYRGEWWAPFRTASLRSAAAGALRRIGSPDALAVLTEAAANGSRSVRKIARAHVQKTAAGRAQ